MRPHRIGRIQHDLETNEFFYGGKWYDNYEDAKEDRENDIADMEAANEE